MAFLVEVILLLACLGVSTLASDSTWFYSPKYIAIWGMIAIITSYVHLAVCGALVGWIVSKINRRKKIMNSLNYPP